MRAEEQAVLTRYFSASPEQQDALKGTTMEAEIDAKVPKLNQHGTLRALRSISKLGKLTYRALGFTGDNTIKKEVIARFLQAEVEAQEGHQNIGITPENYKFKYRYASEGSDRTTFIYQISPRRKQVGLFKGELWLDEKTGLPVREAGQFVKTPSVLMKKLHFVREYTFEKGVSVPKHIQSVAEMRIFGPVEVNINYSNPTPEEVEASSASAAAEEGR